MFEDLSCSQTLSADPSMLSVGQADVLPERAASVAGCNPSRHSRRFCTCCPRVELVAKVAGWNGAAPADRQDAASYVWGVA